MAQNIFGKDVLPTLEVDAHGLLLDCTFVGLPGQLAFFRDPGNLSGFEPMMKKSLDMAQEWGYAGGRFGFEPPPFDYPQLAKLAGLKYEAPTARSGRIAETLDFSPEAELDDKTIVSFTINFEPNESVFSSDRYGAEFNRAIQAASTFGNAVVVIRGHSDPTKTLQELVRAGLKKGFLKRTGSGKDYRYFLDNRPLDMNATPMLVELIKTGRFEGTELQTARDDAGSTESVVRSGRGRQAITRGVCRATEGQSGRQPDAARRGGDSGTRDSQAHDAWQEAKENMRVEFRIVRVPAEAIQQSDFDF